MLEFTKIKTFDNKFISNVKRDKATVKLEFIMSP